MGQVDFNAWKSRNEQTNNTQKKESKGPWVNYFTLKNDKDTAIVRFMHDSPEDFDIVACHRFNINGKPRWVNCIRDPKDPIDNCPLCASEKKVEYRFFIHLIEYTRGEDGKVLATPKVWERPSGYINTFTNLINEYGPLSENIFKVTRNGAAGSTSTTYDIFFGSPNIYKTDMYPNNPKLFEGYKAVGNVVFDYDKEQLEKLLIEGSVESKAESSPTSYKTPDTPYKPENKTEEPRTTSSSESTDNAFARPRRFY